MAMQPEVVGAVGAVGGAIGGGGLTYVIAKYAINKAFGDLSMAVAKVHEFDKAMAAVCVHVQTLAQTIATHDHSLRELSQKLAFYEGLHGRPSKSKAH